MSNPCVSIIVPVYNVEPFLADCLNTLINQTYPNIEIVCIDDGSTDASASILAKYKEQYQQIKVITTENRGQAAARNLGLREASGDFVMFVDSDDWLDTQAIETIFKENFFNQSNVDFACFGIRQVIDGRKLPHRSYSSNEVFTVSESLALKISPEPVAKLYRSSFLRENNIQFPEGLWYEDITFYWSCFSYANQIGTITNVFYNYRKRNDSTMGNSKKKARGMAIHHLYNLEILHKIWSKNQYLQKHKALFEYLIELYVQQAYKYLCDEDKNEFVIKLRFLINQFDFKPKRFSLIFDLVNGNCIIPVKYRWVKSIRKRFLSSD